MNRINSDIMSGLVFLMNFPLIQGLLFGFGLWFFLSYSKKDKDFGQQLCGLLLIFGCGVPVAWTVLSFKYDLSVNKPFYWWVLGAFSSIFFSIFIERKGYAEKILKMGTKKSELERDKKTDVRDVVEKLKKMEEYDPQKYFKKGVWFFGLDSKKAAIYYEREKLLHTQISGASGFGKSVLLGLLASQATEKGEATIVFDPKQGGDEWFPHVCKRATEKSGAKYHFIDIRCDEAQLNIFEGATENQLENLLITTFLLEDRGNPSDYYRGKERKMARFVAENYKAGSTAKSISKEHDKFFRNKENEADGFANQLAEIARIKSINAEKGISLKDAMDNGDFIYIAGDWEDPKFLKVQRMILARIVQIASQRDNTFSSPKQVCVILDEFSFQVSKIFGDSLRIIRDKGLHFVLAHQGLKDLQACPDNMDKEQFAGSVLTNCSLKFTYRAADVETAEYFSDLSGEQLVDDEIRHIDKSLSLTDQVSHERQVRQTEKNLIDKNTMLYLPENCGVLFGNGLAQITNVFPLKVEKSRDSKTVQSFKISEDDANSGILEPDFSNL